MYRYSNGQISLADFKQPVGMNLKVSNRWVKKAQTIPWPEIENRYRYPRDTVHRYLVCLNECKEIEYDGSNIITKMIDRLTKRTT